jgi:hypothetical protein
MPRQNLKKWGQAGFAIILPVFILVMLGLSAQLAGQAHAFGEATPTPGAISAGRIPRGDNLLVNGNFEFGYYPIPELGFEAEDIGNIPHGWGWFKSDTYGKFDIDNNESFRLQCPEDAELLSGGQNSLAIFVQSTDQADARLGIYQTVDVEPGKDYLFSISGTIQAQPGASSPDINHKVQLVFDHTGGTDWTAIPFEEWTLLPWREQELEFKLSGPEDPDLAQVESYFTVVKARSDKMTVFIGAWRRWANWRSAVYTFDCAYLVPLDKIDPYTLTQQLAEFSTTDVDEVVEAAVIEVQRPEATPAAESDAAPPDTQPAAPAEEPVEIPDSGGIPELKDNSLLFIIVSVLVISGLMGAGIWNIRRQKRRS